MERVRWTAPGIVALAVTLCCCPSAFAADTYVDRSDGNDQSGGNDCHSKQKPCQSLLTAIATAGPGDTVFVGGDPQAYTTVDTLTNGKSLVGDDFSTKHSVDTSGKAILDAGAAVQPTLKVTGVAGTVKNLTIRSQTTPLSIQGTVTVTKNRFDEAAQIDQDVVVGASSGTTVKIKDNKFTDPTPLAGAGHDQTALHLAGAAKRVVSKNTFRNFQEGINVDTGGGAVTISKNDISGIHSAESIGLGVFVLGAANPKIVGNRLHAQMGNGIVNGIQVLSDATITRNRILDLYIGVQLKNTPGAVDLDGDAIRTIDNGIGLFSVDDGGNQAHVGDANVTGTTIAGDGDQVTLEQTHLKMDSSVLAATSSGFVMSLSSATCDITFSRGGSTGPAADGCTFQTKKDPKFKPDGLHLKASSPMIDEGNTAKPPKGEKDIDGDKRALDGTGNCKGKKRRDIGADEFKC